MIKSIQNDQKNSSKDQNQENGEIRDFFQSGDMKNEKSRLRAFARTRAKNCFLEIYSDNSFKRVPIYRPNRQYKERN